MSEDTQLEGKPDGSLAAYMFLSDAAHYLDDSHLLLVSLPVSCTKYLVAHSGWYLLEVFLSPEAV